MVARYAGCLLACVVVLAMLNVATTRLLLHADKVANGSCGGREGKGTDEQNGCLDHNKTV